jgi:sulfite exporter TauE/SafE
MGTLTALIYSILFGLLHGILPDEHTWPITFSYAIGGATGRAGLKAGLFFSLAFTVQRALLSEVSYLALAPFLLSPKVNGIVYFVVGIAMVVAGVIVLRKNRYMHFHLLGHHHERAHDMGQSILVLGRTHHETMQSNPAPPPVGWTLVHGFIAGFGFGSFSLFINTVAAPAMPNVWTGFLPGLLFGLGTMAVLIIVGVLFGASLRRTHKLSEAQIKQIGAQTGGRTLFFGGLLFFIFGALTTLGLDSFLPVDTGYVLIGLFMVLVAIPAFIFSWREVRAASRSLERAG